MKGAHYNDNWMSPFDFDGGKVCHCVMANCKSSENGALVPIQSGSAEKQLIALIPFAVYKMLLPELLKKLPYQPRFRV